MNIYGFILGRESELSKAEIFCSLQKDGYKYELILNTKDILIISTKSQSIDIDTLGGTIKLFSILGQDITKDKLQSFIQSNLEINQSEKRINFGISGYGNIQSNHIYRIGKTIKDKIVGQGLKARFVTGKFKDLSSVIVKENKLIERGFELIIIENGGKFTIGQTIAVQDYKAYAKRDYGRSARDDKSGMLPPKLAQILINLGAKPLSSTLYDPFCGSGTVLQESLLMGYKDIYGSDISEKAITDTKENLEWLKNAKVFDSSLARTIEVFQSDALSPSRQIKADLIVGEGYLGEPVRRNVATAKRDSEKLADFYLRVLSNLSKSLNEDGTLVLALPFFIVGKERVFLPITNKLSLTGLKQLTIENIKMTDRNTLLYSRPDAFVGREIFILKKK